MELTVLLLDEPLERAGEARWGKEGLMDVDGQEPVFTCSSGGFMPKLPALCERDKEGGNWPVRWGADGAEEGSPGEAGRPRTPLAARAAKTLGLSGWEKRLFHSGLLRGEDMELLDWPGWPAGEVVRLWG